MVPSNAKKIIMIYPNGEEDLFPSITIAAKFIKFMGISDRPEKQIGCRISDNAKGKTRHSEIFDGYEFRFAY